MHFTVPLSMLLCLVVRSLAYCDTEQNVSSKKFSKLILGKWQGMDGTRGTYIFYPDHVWREAPEVGHRWGQWSIMGNILEFDQQWKITRLDKSNLVCEDPSQPHYVQHYQRIPIDVPPTAGTVKGDISQKRWPSSDRGVVAYASRIGGSTDGCYDEVEIWTDNSQIGHFSLDGKGADDPRYVLRGAWSPDSRFFAFLTISSTGKQSWHATTYFFDRRTGQFTELDRDLTAAAGEFGIFVDDKSAGIRVDDNEVEFEPPDVLVIHVRDNPENPVTVSLSKLVKLSSGAK